MNPAEIIDTLITNMTVKESIVITIEEIKQLSLEEAQDKLLSNFGVDEDHNAIIQGLKFLKAENTGITLANSEWIQRLSL